MSEEHGLKSTMLQSKINAYLNEALPKAEKEGKIDYFKLEINNHNGTLQMDMLYRERGKAY